MADVATILCVPWRTSTRFYVTFLQLVIVFGTSVSLFITLYMVFWFSLQESDENILTVVEIGIFPIPIANDRIELLVEHISISV